MSHTKVVLETLPLPVDRGTACTSRELWLEALDTLMTDEINEEAPWLEEYAARWLTWAWLLPLVTPPR